MAMSYVVITAADTQVDLVGLLIPTVPLAIGIYLLSRPTSGAVVLVIGVGILAFLLSRYVVRVVVRPCGILNWYLCDQYEFFLTLGAALITAAALLLTGRWSKPK